MVTCFLFKLSVGDAANDFYLFVFLMSQIGPLYFFSSYILWLLLLGNAEQAGLKKIGGR